MKRRQGFTIVELLVSMALIIFIMAILSQAFVAAMTTFRDLKAQGDMAQKLRAVTQMLKSDLVANHFDGDRRLSNPYFWLNGPPQQGFFQIYQGSAPSLVPGSLCFIEGADVDGIASYRTVNHMLAFTVKLLGNEMGDFFSASGGMAALSGLFGPPEARYQLTSGGSYNYQWAAVAWFLQPQINPITGTQDTTVADPTTGSPGVPLFTLYRRQALLVPDNNLVQPVQLSTDIGAFTEISCWANGTNLYFNSPIDITVPTRRFWGGQPPYQPIPASSPLYGSDIVLNDVVSFDVRVLPLYPVGTTPPNPNDPFVTLFQPPFTTNFTYTAPPGVTGMVFDTWTSLSDGLDNNLYQAWNVPGTSGVSIPFWNTGLPTAVPPGPLSYLYPVGSAQTIQMAGSGPIILAIQITIRIWDYKTNQTRQTTIVQAM